MVALALGVVDTVIKEFLPTWLLANSDVSLNITGGLIVSLVLVTAAIAAWPLSFQVDKIGERRAITVGLLGALLSLVVVYFAPYAFVAILFALSSGIFLSLVSVSAFPFALKNLSVKNVTLGTGIFFGCLELASGITAILENL